MTDPGSTARRPERRRHNLTRAAFYAHLWLGVIFILLVYFFPAGIAGTLAIRVENGKHYYDLDYTL